MLLKLQRYCMEVRYKKGKHNVHCWHFQPCSFGRHQHMWIFKRSGRGWPYLFNFSQERATTQDNAKVYRESSVYGFLGDHHQWLARKKNLSAWVWGWAGNTGSTCAQRTLPGYSLSSEKRDNEMMHATHIDASNGHKKACFGHEYQLNWNNTFPSVTHV